MKRIKIISVVSVLILITTASNNPPQKFEATFISLEKVNPVPEWFKDAKFGIYFHWGVYSVPAFGNEWYPRTMYIKGSPENKHHIETYGDPEVWPYNYFITGAKDKKGNFVQFAPKLKSEGGNFDPEEWAQLFADAGAKFAGPVAEHHDGFSMWASKVNPWNAKDLGPKLDLVGLLTDAIRSKDMKVILSMHHAYNITGFYEAAPPTSDPKLQMLYGQQGKEKNEAFWLAKHKEIIDNYKPDIIWQDFNLHLISQPVLLQFLSYYYNQAADWNKEVVATFKDGLNTKCAVLDYERGGPQDITENYWLTDDAISSTSWCYTEGLGYYSKKQILHGFIDRISKNGNLLLNISPKADGSISQEQKEILLTMGFWLKKYGEAVYATRAWEKYGEGPTKMGAAHGIMGAPGEGTAKDIRFTRSKDNTILYAILLGWDENQKTIRLSSLSTDRIDLKNLVSVSMINGNNGEYLPLSYKQEPEGLIIHLPEKPFEELAYVIKLSFSGEIPKYNKYADLNADAHYYLMQNDPHSNLLLGADLNFKNNKKEKEVKWKFEKTGNGFYRIISCEYPNKALTCNHSNHKPFISLSDISGNNIQIWKIEETFSGKYKIENKEFPALVLSYSSESAQAEKTDLLNKEGNSTVLWHLKEVCEIEQKPYKQINIPGTIESEDFDTGCPEDAFLDKDETNIGGLYRPSDQVDIEKCSAGGYNVGWTNDGEYLAYTVKINETGKYKVVFYVASVADNLKFHLEYDQSDISGEITVPNSLGYQNWSTVEKIFSLNAGTHILKVVIDKGGFNLDKMVFQKFTEQ